VSRIVIYKEQIEEQKKILLDKMEIKKVDEYKTRRIKLLQILKERENKFNKRKMLEKYIAKLLYK